LRSKPWETSITNGSVEVEGVGAGCMLEVFGVDDTTSAEEVLKLGVNDKQGHVVIVERIVDVSVTVVVWTA
jgi:hypothetical protein